MPTAIPSTTLSLALTPILSAISRYRSAYPLTPTRPPFILGLTGLQGSGKSTWAAALVSAIRDHGYKVFTVSLDDFYHTHDNLVAVRKADPSNGLLRTRGQPGTHEVELAENFFAKLTSKHEGGKRDIAIPAFDKSAFHGEGDRVDESRWERVSKDPPTEVCIFEGWCVGFRPIADEEIRKKWEATAARGKALPESGFDTMTLHRHKLEHLLVVNQNLDKYCNAFMGPQNFNFLVHLDTDDLVNVYRWRIDQETKLRAARGSGMTDQEVIKFVQGYMPSYELYLDDLRKEPFVRRTNNGLSNHLRVVLDVNRAVNRVEEL